MNNNNNNTNITGIPERLITKADLVVGDELVFRKLIDLKSLDSAKKLVYGWNTNMDTIIEKTYVVTEEMFAYHGELIATETIGQWSYHIGISMLKKKEENEVVEETPAEANASVNPNIRVERDPAILQEMKAMVDKKRLKVMLSISASNSERTIVREDMVDKYLDLWADAKYDYFLLFNKQLKTQKDVEIAIDDDSMKLKLKDIYASFPVYAPILEQFYVAEYRENEIKHTHDIKKHSESIYRLGMKLSKYIASFINNEDLNIALSKVMQDKTATHTTFVSIDPYDYLTMSLNQHGWDSCHKITDGCYGTGALSYMLDDATMIAYRENGREYDYNLNGFKFKGNSKSWRQCVYFDKATCAMLFGRQYPNQVNDMTKAIRLHLEDVVADYIKPEENLWAILSNEMIGEYDDLTDLHYSDITNGYDYKFVKLKSLKAFPHFNVGFNVPCLVCGSQEDMSNGSTALCGDCLSGDDGDDNDED